MPPPQAGYAPPPALGGIQGAETPLDRALAVCVENIIRPSVKMVFAKLRDRVKELKTKEFLFG